MDLFYKAHGKPKGPLHGLPVSLKDQFHVKGVETTMGYVGVSNLMFAHYLFEPQSPQLFCCQMPSIVIEWYVLCCKMYQC